ncbi:hypothetical protein RQP46_007819 [Phenoliferia psychrophenolica]
MGHGGRRGAETTVIVYGLEPGIEYEIALDVVGTDDPDSEQTVLEIETPHAATPADHGPPPPYSPALPSPPSEPNLRSSLKSIRASSKRTESVLNASISALKKAVDKGMKEDQRARTRIVSLEEAIRKAREGEVEVRTRERQRTEKRIEELRIEEEEVRGELVRKKEGRSLTPLAVVVAPPPPPPPPTPPAAAHDDEQEDDGHHEIGLADLAKELDTLNRRIEDVEAERRTVAHESLRVLELELAQLEMDLNQLDRDEAHRYNIAAQISSDSLDLYNPHPHHAQHAPPPSSSTFSIPSWSRRTRTPSHQPPQPPPQPSQSQSSFRFFRRQTSDPPPAPLPSAHTSPDGMFHAQSFAQEQQALWASPDSVPASSFAASTARGFAATLRRRSGSLNSAAKVFESSSSNATTSATMSDGEGGEGGKKERWGRAWSQVGGGRKAEVVTVAPTPVPEEAA